MNAPKSHSVDQTVSGRTGKTAGMLRLSFVFFYFFLQEETDFND